MKKALLVVISALAAACSSAPEEERATIASAELTLTPAESKWVAFIAANAVAKLPGTASERAHHAAIVAWWALKEGVLDVAPSPWHHNLCGANVTLDDLGVCSAGSAWQVGMSGIQVPNVDAREVLDMAARIYPRMSTAAILGDVVRAAGLDPSSPSGARIVNSTGALQTSWLLRDPAIGIALQWPFADDCEKGGPSWCYGDWPEARAFAASTTRIDEVIAALEQRFQATGAPASDPCAGATLGDGGYCATWFDASADPNVLFECAAGRTSTKTTCASGCKRMPNGYNDVCEPGGTTTPAGDDPAPATSSARSAMMARAKQWIDAKMPYCGGLPGGPDAICGGTCTGRPRSAEWDKYRSDCSGFVSWVWQLAYEDGHRTWGFAPFDQEGAAFSEVIPAPSLLPGDALNSATNDISSQHIILFAGWVDQASGIVKTYEEANCTADLVVRTSRTMTTNADGTVSLEGVRFWPIRKIGVN